MSSRLLPFSEQSSSVNAKLTQPNVGIVSVNSRHLSGSVGFAPERLMDVNQFRLICRLIMTRTSQILGPDLPAAVVDSGHSLNVVAGIVLSRIPQRYARCFMTVIVRSNRRRDHSMPSINSTRSRTIPLKPTNSLRSSHSSPSSSPLLSKL